MFLFVKSNVEEVLGFRPRFAALLHELLFFFRGESTVRVRFVEELAKFTNLLVLEALTENGGDDGGEVFVGEDLGGVDHAEEEPVVIDVVEVDPLGNPGLVGVRQVGLDVVAHGLGDFAELVGEVVLHELGQEVEGFGGDLGDLDGGEGVLLFLDVDEALDVLGDLAELGAGEGDAEIWDTLGDLDGSGGRRDVLAFLVVGEGIAEDEILLLLLVPGLLVVALGVEDNLLGEVDVLESFSVELGEHGSSRGGSGVSHDWFCFDGFLFCF